MHAHHEHEWQTPLLGEIAAFIAKGAEDEPTLDSLARRLVQRHYERSPLYRRLCDSRRVDLAKAATLSDIPALPSEAFKRTEIHIAPESIVRTFTTSGTTGGEARKGAACYSADDMRLMDIAIDVNAQRYLFPDHAVRKTLVLILAPPPEMAPRMIMVYGMDRLRRHYGLPESAFLVGPDGLDMKGLIGYLERASATGAPVTLIGASFGFVHLFDRFAERGLAFDLGEGSRVMDAGGFKGKSRDVARAEMVEAFGQYLGIPPEHCVNLLGLTEFASQFYDDALAAHFENRPVRRGKQNPPWTRTWAADPETLEVLPHHEQGILRHLDLANGGHPAIVQTDDWGVTYEDGFEVLGRVGGAEARGCSITVDELMSTQP